MRDTTNRQFAVWMEWLDKQWNNPSRSDHYLAQIATEVCRTRARSPGAVKHETFIISFKERGKGKAAVPEMTIEQATAIAKARSLARVGMSPQVILVPKSPQPPQDPPGPASL